MEPELLALLSVEGVGERPRSPMLLLYCIFCLLPWAFG